MRGADWKRQDPKDPWVGVTAKGDRLHAVYFNRYGVPLSVCRSLEMTYASREEAATPTMREAPRCQGGCW